jgi:hypothetical protein
MQEHKSSDYRGRSRCISGVSRIADETYVAVHRAHTRTMSLPCNLSQQVTPSLLNTRMEEPRGIIQLLIVGDFLEELADDRVRCHFAWVNKINTCWLSLSPPISVSASNHAMISHSELFHASRAIDCRYLGQLPEPRS